ncbi:hypothetical protein E2320_020579, partial [Naja naja]
RSPETILIVLRTKVAFNMLKRKRERRQLCHTPITHITLFALPHCQGSKTAVFHQNGTSSLNYKSTSR